MHNDLSPGVRSPMLGGDRDRGLGLPIGNQEVLFIRLPKPR